MLYIFSPPGENVRATLSWAKIFFLSLSRVLLNFSACFECFKFHEPQKSLVGWAERDENMRERERERERDEKMREREKKFVRSEDVDDFLRGNNFLKDVNFL